MTLYKWSQTASADATADSTINWAEGQSPSSVNDSARAMMAAVAKWRDDIIGANLGTGGTSTAYTVNSNQVFDTRAHMAAQTLSVYFSVTNGANATLNVDGLGAFPIVTDGTFAAVPAGTLIAGSFYDLAFSNANSVWILKNFYQLPYTVPVGGLIDFIGTTSPNSNFILPYGQAISRVTYANLFSLISTTFGAGDGSTTFNVPDLRGRMLVGKDDMGGSAAGRVTTAGGGLDGATLGATGGAQNTTLITANLPAYTPAGTIGAITVTSTVADILRNPSGVNTNAGSTFPVGSTPGQAITSTAAAGSTSFTGTPQGGTSTAFSRLPPALIVNKLLRVI